MRRTRSFKAMTDKPKAYRCGLRGCAAKTKRRGVERYCAQLAIVNGSDGKRYCWYHNPQAPKKFGQGY